MTNIETFYSKESSERLERRTYKSGGVRYYMGIERLWRLEADLAKRLLKKKRFITSNELKEFHEDESIRMIHGFYLSQAQKKGKTK